MDSLKSADRTEEGSLWCLPSVNEMSMMMYKAFIDAEREEKANKRIGAKGIKNSKKLSIASKGGSSSTMKILETGFTPLEQSSIDTS